MGRFLVVSLTLLVLSGCLVAEAAKKRTEKKEQGGCSKSKKTCIDALGASGKIRVALNGKKTSDSDAFTLSFDYIKELDENLKAIKGKAGHSYENFAKAKFAFSELEETTIQGIKATKFDFQGTLDGPGAIMTVTIYIIKEEKNITLCDNSTYTVQEGTIKYNVELKNWTFCGGSGGEDCGKNAAEGKYIDFGIEMKKKDDKAKSEEDKGKGKDGKERKRGKKVKMGSVDMNLPDALDLDGGCSKLADISISTQGSKQLLNLRFPRFKNMILYDPFITGEESDGSMLAANVSFMLFAVMAVFIHLFY